MSMKQIIISTMLLFGVCHAEAQNIKRPDSYNYQRGIEAIQDEKMGDALEYFNKDIGENLGRRSGGLDDGHRAGTQGVVFLRNTYSLGIL